MTRSMIKKIKTMFSREEQVKRFGTTAPYSKTDDRIYELQMKTNEIIDKMDKVCDERR